MNILKISKFDTANGPGIRTTVWVSGCSHKCKGCHNSHTWDPTKGTPLDNDLINSILDSLSPSYVSGITFSGGDPLYPLNVGAVTSLAGLVRSRYPDKSIWVYTGYLYEEVKNYEIMNYIDVLVDGPYVEYLRNISLPYRGSTNQRVIDVKLSINSNQIINYNMHKEC